MQEGCLPRFFNFKGTLYEGCSLSGSIRSRPLSPSQSLPLPPLKSNIYRLQFNYVASIAYHPHPPLHPLSFPSSAHTPNLSLMFHRDIATLPEMILSVSELVTLIKGTLEKLNWKCKLRIKKNKLFIIYLFIIIIVVVFVFVIVVIKDECIKQDSMSHVRILKFDW